jgi:hypothetical protein
MSRKKEFFLSILVRFTIIIIISSSLIVFSGALTTYGPRKFTYTNDSFNWEYKLQVENTSYNIVFDQHSHTIYSDGILTVEQNVLWHIAHGFNAIAITDHNTIRNAGKIAQMAHKYQDKIVIIQGMEWTTDRIHMNLLGISSKVAVPLGSPTDLQIQEAINATHDQGGVVVVDHIPWSLARMPDHPTRAELLNWGVDYIEIVNHNEYDLDSESWCNNTGGFGKITGTDMHSPSNVYCWTLMNTSEFTADAVMEQLRTRNTSIYFNETGSYDNSIPAENIRYNIVEPFILFGQYFINYVGPGLVRWSSIFIALSYITIGFFLFESSKFGIEKLIENRKRKKKQDDPKEEI